MDNLNDFREHMAKIYVSFTKFLIFLNLILKLPPPPPFTNLEKYTPLLPPNSIKMAMKWTN